MKNRMRTIAMMFLIALLPATLSAREYLIPFLGFSGVPLDSPVYTVLDSNTAGIWGNAKGENTPYDQIYNEYVNSGTIDNNNYNDWNMIATGGAVDIVTDDFHKDVIITMTVSSPAGLNFVSLGKPSIVRPYNIQMMMLAHVNSKTLRFDTVTFDLNGGTQVFKLSDLCKENGESIPSAGIINMHFDMILSLPGDRDYVDYRQGTMVKDGQLKLESGSIIPIIEADDYSSVINIRMSVKYLDEDNAPESISEISIPLNGFYKKGTSAPDSSKTPFALSIRPLPVCANIDIENQQGALIPIADISFMNAELGGQDKIFTIPTMGFFFSSSPNPFPEGLHEPFRLVHDEIPADDPSLLNVRNNIGYTLKVFPGPIVFDGTMTVSPTEQLVSAYDGKIIIPETSINEGINDLRHVKMQEYSGRLFLELESSGLKMMKGRYSSRIYVHVISDGMN